MITILAEKPDVGNKIAAALDCITLKTGKRISFDQLKSYEKQIKAQQAADGYLSIRFDGDECCVTWGFGHLAGLKQAKDYNPEYKSWYKIPLPFFPEKYEIQLRQIPKEKDKYGYNEKIKKQFELIRKLFSSSRYIINATDFDREGETIFSYIYELTGCRKPVKRACFSSQTKEGIREGFYENLIESSKMKTIEAAGRTRAIADWVVGSNLTVANTLHNTAAKEVLSLGRVQTPTLQMLVQRELAVTGFTSSKYYTVTAIFSDSSRSYSAEYVEKKIEKKTRAEEILKKVQGKKGTITKIEKKKSQKAVPHLYSLSALQMDANSLYGYTLQQTLEAAQSLYDSGLTTYPRTNSQFLTEDMEPTVNKVLDTISSIPEYSGLIIGRKRKFDFPHFFNNSKVESHYAIIPTGVLPSGSLQEREKRVYDLVARSVIQMLYPPAVLEKTTATTNVDGELFLSNGIRVLDEGWTRCAGKLKENILPDIKEGESFDGKYEMSEKTTAPPKRYTDKTLLSAMLSAGKELDDADLRKAMVNLDIKGIGTEATRAGIIETLLNRKYIERKGKSLCATKRGIDLITNLPLPELKSAELTAKWETRLDQIAKGEEDPKKFIDDIEKQTEKWCKQIQESKTITSEPKKGALLCPKCGQVLRRYPSKGWGCSGYRSGCDFFLKEEILKKKLTDKQVQALLTKGKTNKISGFISKRTGEPFEAYLVLDRKTGKIGFQF